MFVSFNRSGRTPGGAHLPGVQQGRLSGADRFCGRLGQAHKHRHGEGGHENVVLKLSSLRDESGLIYWLCVCVCEGDWFILCGGKQGWRGIQLGRVRRILQHVSLNICFQVVLLFIILRQNKTKPLLPSRHRMLTSASGSLKWNVWLNRADVWHLSFKAEHL